MLSDLIMQTFDTGDEDSSADHNRFLLCASTVQECSCDLPCAPSVDKALMQLRWASTTRVQEDEVIDIIDRFTCWHCSGLCIYCVRAKSAKRQGCEWNGFHFYKDHLEREEKERPNHTLVEDQSGREGWN